MRSMTLYKTPYIEILYVTSCDYLVCLVWECGGVLTNPLGCGKFATECLSLYKYINMQLIKLLVSSISLLLLLTSGTRASDPR